MATPSSAARRFLLSLAVLVGSTGLVLAGSAPAQAYSYDQSGWHAGSVWNEGTTASTTVIDCESMVIANMGTGTVVTPGTGIVAGIGVEVDLDGAHPKVGESFYIHIWGRSIGTPCGAEGFIPIFSLPAGLALDSSKAVACYSDGVAIPDGDAACPQPGASGQKFQSAQPETGNSNSYKILCGYGSGCLGYAWPAAYGHGFEFGIPVKATSTFNAAQVTGGAWVIDASHNGLLALKAPLNVFAATAGNGQVPGTVTPVGGGAPIPDPGTAYRVVYGNPSTYASPDYPNNPGLGSTTYGVLSTGTAYTNHVPGFVVIARDSDQTKLTGMSTSLQTLSDQTDAGTIPVNQFTYGAVDNVGASYRVDYDWGDTNVGVNVWGTNPSAFAAGTRYYWRIGFAPTPDGDTSIPTAKVTWGAVQSFVAPPAIAALKCNGKAVTVSIALGQQPTDGNDVILGTAGNDSINGGNGNDTICGMGGKDYLVGGTGNDMIFGGDGDDTILPGTGMDGAYGEGGTDTVSYADATGAVTYNSSTCSSGYLTVCGAAGLDALSGPGRPLPERFVGSRFDDVISLDAPGTTMVYGGDGNDTITGSTGSDTLIGGAGRDTITALAGNDTLFVRDSATDTVRCDDGTDTVTADRVDVLSGCESVRLPVLPPVAMPASWVAKWPVKTGTVRKARVGKRLRITAPVLSAAGASHHLTVRYQWYAAGKSVRGATTRTLKVKKALKGKKVTVTTTVSRTGYTPLSRNLGYGKAR